MSVRFHLCGLLAAAACALPGMAVGPDVITSGIGDEGGGVGFIKHATLNGVTSYSITSVACNIGDATASWIYWNNTHPLIGTQVYRLHNGRFEQIGMNWLKHSFCAADWPSCTNLVPGSTYQGNNTCDTLGLFATDTYDAFLNGQQSNLGPRSEVNASTGGYPYPPNMGWGNGYNCLTKRIQIANSDFNPANFPGARYFAEIHYMTSDEARAVRTNNASYREILVGSLSNGQTGETGCTSTAQGYDISFIGATTPMRPAVEAWRSVDPSVTLAYYDIPSDGRIAVAAKVTDLGGSLWQYEYAIYNHNSDKSIGSFTIPKAVGSGVTISSVGFHDIAYHSGEPFDGTDWPGVVASSTISWATTPWTTNPNANAIRWSTTYNFRFRANRGPVSGSVTLGLFKGASPGSISVPGIPVPSGAATCPADFNHVGGVTLQDLFDFLAAWFALDPISDFNHDSNVSLQDVFDYLGAYFTPCP